MPRSLLLLFRWIALILILCASALTGYAWIQYSHGELTSEVLPVGTKVGGIPVGGLDREAAAARINAYFNLPVEMIYQGARIQAGPDQLGFVIDMDAMLDQAEASPKLSFWDYLWNRTAAGVTVDLQAQTSDEKVKAYLESEIMPRYDQPAQSMIPLTYEPYDLPSQIGNTLNIDQAVVDIQQALISLENRQVSLTSTEVAAPRLAIDNLKFQLERLINNAGYTGVAELYIQNLTTQDVIHFALSSGQEIEPDISFSAASIIKIPIMVSVFRRSEEPTSDEVVALLARMIEESDNTASDEVAQLVVDEISAPILVTQDMQALGLQNTFWGGFFYLGAPLLDLYTTPANQRTDINTDPDIYSQVAPADIGWLLGQIYACAEDGSGALTETWPGEITTTECQQMLELLKGNHLGQLIQSGLPDGTPYAHKHGWVVDTADGLLHNLADAGVVYTPGNDYAVSIFFHEPGQLNFDAVNAIYAQIAQVTYAYFQQSN